MKWSVVHNRPTSGHIYEKLLVQGLAQHTLACPVLGLSSVGSVQCGVCPVWGLSSVGSVQCWVCPVPSYSSLSSAVSAVRCDNGIKGAQGANACDNKCGFRPPPSFPDVALATFASNKEKKNPLQRSKSIVVRRNDQPLDALLVSL